MLPGKEINVILQKFGPQILTYLKEVGYFDQESAYSPIDLTSKRAMDRYLKASKAKNAEVWQVVQRYLLPELESTGEAFIAAYGLKEAINVKQIADGYIKSRGGELIRRMTRTDQKRLTAFIWQDSGQNERVVARQILKQPNLSSIVDNSGWRARTIIRTEKSRATRGASSGFATNAGATTHQRHEVGDNRTRPPHRAMMGEVQKIGVAYSNGELYPGQTEINCRGWESFGFDKDLASCPEPITETLEAIYS